MGYTWLGMQKLTWEEVLQRHEKGELAGCFRLYDDNSEAMIDRGYDFAGDILAHHKKGGEFGEDIGTVDPGTGRRKENNSTGGRGCIGTRMYG